MADVTLAESGGQYWLVRGDEYVDELLANNLPPGITIAVVACVSRSEAWDLWQPAPGTSDPGEMPWIINPAIVQRLLKGTASTDVHFTAWSAMLTDDARASIAAAAEWLRSEPTGHLTLRQFCPEEAAAGLADLQRLRGQLTAAALAGAGADNARLEFATELSVVAADSERLELVRVTRAAITSG